MNQDVRWEQRFSNFVKALNKLTEAVNYINEHLQYEEQEDLQIVAEIVKEGLIQRFEYTHELAWNVMKDYAAYQGNNLIKGSRDATREAFNMELITDGEVWMDMIRSRNQTSHTYNEETAHDIYGKIIRNYHNVFQVFAETMEALRSGSQTSLFD